VTTWLRTVRLVLVKDLVVELRNRELLASMVLFSALTVVVFAFAFDLGPAEAKEIGPGVIWVTLLFAGTVGLTKAYDRERDNGCLDALLLAPGGPSAVYVAKVLGLVLFMLLVQLVTIPLLLAFLGVEIQGHGVGVFVLAQTLGILGFASVGALFGGMLSNARLREVLLPLVVYPIAVPVLIAGVELTELAIQLEPPAFEAALADEGRTWLALMGGFDALFLVLPAWVFGRVMVD
jgi:heme exporter protein B